jgi:hypothetical protein
MSFSRLPDYILMIIMEYIRDNTTSITFVSLCRYTKTLFYKYGFIKHISIGPHDSIFDICISAANHKNTLNLISICYRRDPQHFIFFWPKRVFFNWCTTKDKLNPTKETQTEELFLLNDRNSAVQINWNKFKNLKRLELTGWNVDFKGIDVCKNLKSIQIGNIKYNSVCKLLTT